MLAPTISGPISNSVTRVVQNAASSQLTLSGANSYTGATTVSLVRRASAPSATRRKG